MVNLPFISIITQYIGNIAATFVRGDDERESVESELRSAIDEFRSSLSHCGHAASFQTLKTMEGNIPQQVTRSDPFRNSEGCGAHTGGPITEYIRQRLIRPTGFRAFVGNIVLFPRSVRAKSAFQWTRIADANFT